MYLGNNQINIMMYRDNWIGWKISVADFIVVSALIHNGCSYDLLS